MGWKAISRVFATSNGPLWSGLQHFATGFGILLAATQLLSAHDTGVIVQQFQKLIANFQQMVKLIGDSSVAIGIILATLGPAYGIIRAKMGNKIADVKATALDPAQPKAIEAKEALVVATAALPEVNQQLTTELTKVAEVIKKEGEK